jgi:hypothetical protein
MERNGQEISKLSRPAVVQAERGPKPPFALQVQYLCYFQLLLLLVLLVLLVLLLS